MDDFKALADRAHGQKTLVCAAVDPLALTVYAPPSERGADIACGSAQRFGVPQFFGKGRRTGGEWEVNGWRMGGEQGGHFLYYGYTNTTTATTTTITTTTRRPPRRVSLLHRQA